MSQRKRTVQAITDSDGNQQKKQRTCVKHVHGFPWSTSYDVNICALWELANGQPAVIPKLMKELGIVPCPTYDQVRSRITTQEVLDTRNDWLESMLKKVF